MAKAIATVKKKSLGLRLVGEFVATFMGFWVFQLFVWVKLLG